MACNCRCASKKIVTHQVCGPDQPFCGPSLPPPSQYLYWSTRPIICYTSTDEVKRSWNLKRRTPTIPDILYEEMYDVCRNRYFWKWVAKMWNKNCETSDDQRVVENFLRNFLVKTKLEMRWKSEPQLLGFCFLFVLKVQFDFKLHVKSKKSRMKESNKKILKIETKEIFEWVLSAGHSFDKILIDCKLLRSTFNQNQNLFWFSFYFHKQTFISDESIKKFGF